jgi:SpoVK/Ycf46/Vps4 family AAA+-type ATPase
MGFRNLLGIQIREDFKDTLELPDPLLRKFHKEAKKNKRSNDAVVSSISLNDVVLDEEAKTKIYYLIKAAKKDSQFVFKLLFSGPPGTGKTYTAKAIAGELNKKLFILDLSKTLNMFVGETEKSLSALFSEAEETNGIILIDEADSLLKERKTTFQRWESTEVNHILKLLEETKSPVILCTNLYESLDDALLRRIDEIVDFKIPDKIARALIWEKEIEKNGISSLNLNIDELTEIELSGGLISNVAKKAKIMMIAFEGERIIDTSEVKLFALDEKSKMGKDFFNKKICGFKV